MEEIITKANKLLDELKTKEDKLIFEMDGGKEYLGMLKGCPVIYSPRIMKRNNEILGMATFNGEIIVDDEFLNLSTIGKKNVLYHEVGHLLLMHLNLLTLDQYLYERKKASNNGDVLFIELQADLYSFVKLTKEEYEDAFRDAMMEEFDACIRHGRDAEEVIRRIKFFTK